MASDVDARHERIEREAADWLAALDTGRADRNAFEQWRARDAAHAVAFIRVESAWHRLDSLRRDGTTAPLADAAPRPVLPRRRALAAAGAAIAVGAGGALFVASQAAARTIETAVGERRRFYPAAGVCLDLNTASRLRWWMAGDAIEVELQRGEVSLDLSPGAPPCTLEVGPARLSIERGHCIARLRPAEMVDVFALSGKVRLLPMRGAAASSVPDRSKLMVTPDTATTRALSDAEWRAASAWQGGELLFDGEPLSVAVDEFNRYLPTPLVLDDPGIGDVRLGGRFLTDDPAEFLRALRVNFGIRAEPRDGKIMLLR